jgi:integrase
VAATSLAPEQARAVTDDIAEMADTAALQARDTALFTLLYGCGLRIAEALALNVRDAPLQGADAMLRVVGKGGKERIVPVLPAVREAIGDWLRLHPNRQPASPLFLGARGKRLDAAVAQKVLRDFRRLHGLPEHATPHALQHSFATHLLAGGADAPRPSGTFPRATMVAPLSARIGPRPLDYVHDPSRVHREMAGEHADGTRGVPGTFHRPVPPAGRADAKLRSDR